MVLDEDLRGGRRRAVVADFTPEVERRVGVDARSAELGDEESAGFKRRIANDFSGEAEARAACQPGIAGVDFLLLGGGR